MPMSIASIEKDHSLLSIWIAPIVVMIVALCARLLFIHWWPDAYQFDAYQRWAGREHLYIQVWLPATQSVVWITGKLGGTMLATRYVFAIWSVVTLGLATILCRQLGGPRAPWMFLPMAVFGPFLIWSTVPYQETTLLFFLFSALVVGRKFPVLGDILMGGLALVRYEGWPLIIVHCILRRTWKSLVAIWGMILWLGVKYFELLTPHAASPDSFADWQDIGDNLNVSDILRLSEKLWIMVDSAGTAWIVLSAFAFVYMRRKSLQREHWMLLIAFAGQCAATFGWLLSLGVAFSRMMVLPSLFMAILMACAYATLWERSQWKMKTAAIVSLLALSAWTVRDAKIDQRLLNKATKRDRNLVRLIEKCSGDTWAIVPRKHSGPRKRHDGCEVVQGLTNMIAGRDFDCIPWGWGGPQEATMKARWSNENKEYTIFRVSGTPVSGCPY
jgi:hypothetical protein